MRLFAALMLLFTGCAPALADEAQFRSQMIELFRGVYPDGTFVPGEKELEIRVEGGSWDQATINLHRIFHFCQTASQTDCETVKTEFVTKLNAKPQTLDAASLRIIVRDRDYMAYIDELERKSGERQAVRRQIGEDLFAILASDGSETIALVGDKGLAELHLSEEAAWDRAWRQTVAVLPAIPEPAKFREQAMAFESEEYLASITADLAAWQKISNAAGPNLFMTVVSDQFVFVGPMPDGPDLEAFRRTVQEDCAAQPRCVSPNIYRFRGGRWVIAR